MLLAQCVVDEVLQVSTSHLFVPGRLGIVVVDLFRAFGAASLLQADYSPSLLTLPECSLSYENVSDLRVTENGKVLAVLVGTCAYLILLPDTLVRTAANAAVAVFKLNLLSY